MKTLFLDADPGETVDAFARRMIVLANHAKAEVQGCHSSRFMKAIPGSLESTLIDQWDFQSPTIDGNPPPMNIPDKEEIDRLSAAIMRRIEFDQCIHASSIEDEIGKWVREVLHPQQHASARVKTIPTPPDVAEYMREMVQKLSPKTPTLIGRGKIQHMCREGTIESCTTDKHGITTYHHRDGTDYRIKE